MALRIRRDVQKASYYVWFLGAQEARGLRGARVLYPAVPRLLERSREQEPLKVTLQVSHKGLKIVQGSAKHFIPHGAITCSMRSGDVVACVLLLYNPATRCPLHVHAYRCDSETTASALHAQLQVLVDRPENQRRFAELETRLGLGANTGANAPKQNGQIDKGRRFDSSLGSDTGTSTRESDCSEEPPSGAPVSLFDSLAAELRQKLGAGGNGSGPPLLLPPRDYDTVHRSQGNLTAIELRRCRNSAIVGTALATPTSAPVGSGGGVIPSSAPPGRGVSSRGSSGFGSDPTADPDSPDRVNDRANSCSSDEEWNNDIESSVFLMHEQKRSKPLITSTPALNSGKKSGVPYDNLDYHHHNQRPRSISPEKHIRYRERYNENERHLSPRRYKDYTPRYRDEVIPYKDEMRYRQNLDIDELYQEEEPYPDKEPYRDPYVATEMPKFRREKSMIRGTDDNAYENDDKYDQDYRQDYREPANGRYKSSSGYMKQHRAISPPRYQQREYVDEGYSVKRTEQQDYNNKYDDKKRYKSPQPRSVLAEDRQRAPSVNSGNSGGSVTLLASPRDRFKDAKEKFQMMERARQQDLVNSRKPKKESGRAWSSDEEDANNYRPRPNLRRHVSSAAPHHMNSNSGKILPKIIPNMKHHQQSINPQPHPRNGAQISQSGYHDHERRLDRMIPSKSLGNLAKGYRHSYAEPQPVIRRQLGGSRVGIAAVHQY